MKHLSVATLFALGLSLSSTSYAQSHYEDFDSYTTPTGGPISTGPFYLTGTPMVYVDHSPSGSGMELRWCDSMDIDVTMNQSEFQFDMLVLTSTPVTVTVTDSTGATGTVVTGSTYGYGAHQVIISAGPDAHVELRGGGCETWIDNLIEY